MIRIFTKDDDTNYPVHKFPETIYLKRRVHSELLRIQDYYYNRESTVNNQHMLARLIDLTYPSLNEDPFTVFKQITAVKDYTSRQLGISSTITFGKIHNNILYKQNSKELFISVDTNIDPFDFKNNWMNYSPCRIIYNDDNELDFYNFDGRKSKYMEGLTIVEIDITILILMYNFWSLERLKKSLSIDSTIFVKNIVLPKLMGSQLDISIWDRYSNIFLNRLGNDGNKYYTHPLVTLKFKDTLDDILYKVKNRMVNVNMRLPNIILHVPTIYNNNMLDALRINIGYLTKQSEWCLWLSRLLYISDLIDMIPNVAKSNNSKYLNSLPYEIRSIENGSTPLLNMIDGDIKIKIELAMEKIKEKIGKR